MAFKDKLSKEEFKYFQTLDKHMLRTLHLDEDTIVRMFKMDTKMKVKPSMHVMTIAALCIVGLSRDEIIPLLDYCSREHIKYRLNYLYLYILKKDYLKPEEIEAIETELYFENEELLNRVIQLNHSAKRVKSTLGSLTNLGIY